MRSKTDLSLAFLFAAAAQSVRERYLRRPDAPSRPRPTHFRRRRAAESLAGPWRGEVVQSLTSHREAAFAALRTEWHRNWMRTKLERLRADDEQIRRACGKRVLPP